MKKIDEKILNLILDKIMLIRNWLYEVGKEDIADELYKCVQEIEENTEG